MTLAAPRSLVDFFRATIYTEDGQRALLARAIMCPARIPPEWRNGSATDL